MVVILANICFVGTPRSSYETSTLDRSPKKSRGVAGTTASMEAIPTANSNARHSTAFTSSAVTTPTTPPDEHDQRPKSYVIRKPVGGIAVLPPMEMKRIEDQRKTPTPTPGSTEPKQRPFSQTSIKSPTSETSEVCVSCSNSSLLIILYFVFIRSRMLIIVMFVFDVLILHDTLLFIFVVIIFDN